MRHVALEHLRRYPNVEGYNPVVCKGADEDLPVDLAQACDGSILIERQIIGFGPWDGFVGSATDQQERGHGTVGKFPEFWSGACHLEGCIGSSEPNDARLGGPDRIGGVAVDFGHFL